ncbi:MAG: hypothetical protein GYA21_08865 [Myxococcales bacterium]|nr:hypothetical protein [Myxococcales bacterium]
MASKQCPHAADCPLFAAFQVRAFLRIWQMNYCDATFERCVRYQRIVEGKEVPLSLMPNGKQLPDLGAPKKE